MKEDEIMLNCEEKEIREEWNGRSVEDQFYQMCKKNFLFDDGIAQMIEYDLNYKVKELLVILEYYGIDRKSTRKMSCKKQDIISQIMVYENNINNQETVLRRKTMWFYLYEMKRDKFMKRFIIY